MDSIPDILSKYEKWQRLQILLCEGGITLYKDILTKLGVKNIRNGKEIYDRLQRYGDWSQIQNLQWYQTNAICPSSKAIDTDNMDLSISFLILIILDKQKKYPSIKTLRNLRNKLSHMSENERDMTVQQFNDYWHQIWDLLKDLGCDMNVFRDLKSYDCSSEEFKKRFKDIEGRAKIFYFFWFFKYSFKE